MTKTILAGLAAVALLSTAWVGSASAENRHGMLPSRQMMHHKAMSQRDMMMMRHHRMMIRHHMHHKAM